MNNIPRPAFPRCKPNLIALLLALSGGALCSPAYAETYAPWLVQIGVNSAVESAANWGKDQILGVVDTGINATHPMFSVGQVSQTLSSCAAVTFTCSNGFADDNDHGTAVASIAAGSLPWQYGTASYGGYTTVTGNFIGVAPAANIVAEKVLDASGSAYSTDVANGIRKAADAGVNVINVSITYGNDSATVAAINYAAAKGAFIVWAGGNSSQNLLNNASTSGLTQTAINHLIFAGSVNSANKASSFTNRPGSGSLISTSKTKTAYSTRWIMAPGEAIIAPSTTSGDTVYSYWYGTSMAAPIVSGSLILLQSAWPILKTNGTTANLLLSTATDLGSKGVDRTYGYGLVNLQAAFNPYGSLTVTRVNGQSIAVSSLTSRLLTSGALGSLSSIQSTLANYTAFDDYARNFSVNLAGLIQKPRTAVTSNPLPTNTYSGPSVISFTDGEFAYSLQSSSNPAAHIGEFGYNAEQDKPVTLGYSLYTSRTGRVIGFGYGASSSYSFAKALYNNDLSARQMGDFDASNLTSLAQGGYQLAYGAQLSPSLRMAASFSTSANPTIQNPAAPQSSQYKVGLSYSFNPEIAAGVTVSNIAEQNSLLGASYRTGSILALGENATHVVGFSLTYRIAKHASLVFNTENGFTRAGGIDANSLFADKTAIQSRAVGVSYLQDKLWQDNDQFSASIKQPLRVTAGSAALMTASVDEQGYAVYDKTWSSLVPDGREIDYTLTYRLPTSKTASLMLQAAYQRDVFNIAGNHNAILGLAWNKAF